MRRKTAFISMILVAEIIGSLSVASANGRWYAARRVGVGVGVGYGLGYGMAGYGYGGAASSYSLQQQANADTIRAMGQYEQMQSQSMINYEQARSTYIDNQQKWNQVYLERKKALQQMKDDQHQATVARRQQEREAEAKKPPAPGPAGLSVRQLDPATGQIRWPTALATTPFDSQRRTLDDLFALRAKTNTMSELSSQIDDAVRDMKTVLRSHIRDMNSQDYIAARKFLDSLAVDGRSAVE